MIGTMADDDDDEYHMGVYSHLKFQISLWHTRSRQNDAKLG